jgi:hypothetical protein
LLAQAAMICERNKQLSSWQSWHLFYHSDIDIAVARFVKPTVLMLLRESTIDSFFFVRYGLGGPHVRLRCRVHPGYEDGVAERVMSLAEAFLQSFPSTRSLPEEDLRRHHAEFLADEPYSEDRIYADNSLASVPFVPEIDRYGGPHLLGHSLDYFAISSVSALAFIDVYRKQDVGKRLTAALPFFTRQALGFARSGESFLDTLAYSVALWGEGQPALIRRGDDAFERHRQAYCRFMRGEMEAAIEIGSLPSSGISLLYQAALLLDRDLKGVSAATWQRVVGSQMHMTANRLGLGTPEEIYLGRLLWRAAHELATKDCAFWSTFSGACDRRRATDPTRRLDSLCAQTLADLAAPGGSRDSNAETLPT